MFVRPMIDADYEAAFRLWTHTAGMGMRQLDDSFEGISRFLKRNPLTNFVAMEDVTLVGVILCGHDGRRGYIYHAAVDQNRRGQGIGKELLEHALHGLKAEGIHKAALVVYKDNGIGNSFWDRMGFETRSDLNYRNKSLNDLNK